MMDEITTIGLDLAKRIFVVHHGFGGKRRLEKEAPPRGFMGLLRPFASLSRG
jgi:hypothetical protein